MGILPSSRRHVVVNSDQSLGFGVEAQINFVPLILKRLTITGSTLRALSNEQKAIMAKEIVWHIWPKIEEDAMKPMIDSVYAFEDVAKAHERMESGEHMGKFRCGLRKPSRRHRGHRQKRNI